MFAHAHELERNSARVEKSGREVEHKNRKAPDVASGADLIQSHGNDRFSQSHPPMAEFDPSRGRHHLPQRESFACGHREMVSGLFQQMET
jgi:hypothetical protein